MSTVNFHYTSSLNCKVKRANTVTTPKQTKTSISNLNLYSNLSIKMGQSCVQFSSTVQMPKRKTMAFHFPSKDLSIGDSSIEFHERHNDNLKLLSQSQDEHNAKTNLCKGGELSISSIYEEEKRLKLTTISNQKRPSKNPMIKSEFKSFKKYTYKALNQPEEVNQNHNILDNISDSDDYNCYNTDDNCEYKYNEIIIPPINTTEESKHEEIEEESSIECDIIFDEDDCLNENGGIENKMKMYQSINGPIIPSTKSNNGMFNFKILLTDYYNESDNAPLEKIASMEKNLKEIEKYKQSIEESKEMIQQLNRQLNIQTTCVNPINQSSLLYQGKLPDEKSLWIELNEMKTRCTKKTEKFKAIKEKLKDAIIKASPINGNNLC